VRAKFCIHGDPQGKGRPRFSTVCGHVHTRTPDETVLYENLVKTEYRQQVGVKFPDDAMLDVRIFAYYPIPKSASKRKRQAMLERKIRPTKKPDWDNVGKVICDSLNGIAYRDDAQVVDSMVRKFYGEDPKVVVTIEEIKTA
jgi:Holliday junction resolvase RusA-like endonuclease